MAYVVIYRYPSRHTDVVGPFDSFEDADNHGIEWLHQDNRLACGWWFEVEPITSPEEA